MRRFAFEAEPKLCECGCGRPAPIAKLTNTKWGHVKGQPVRFIRGHALRINPEAHYEIDDGGCWIWRGRVTGGYGRFQLDHVSHPAHRWMYEKHVGPVPAGLQLDHLCRNTRCVNPAHLEPVTGTENVRRGKATKLTAPAVRDIRNSTEPLARLAERYGVSYALIASVRMGRGWKEVA